MCRRVTFASKIRANLPATGTAAMAEGEKSVANTIWLGVVIATSDAAAFMLATCPLSFCDQHHRGGPSFPENHLRLKCFRWKPSQCLLYFLQAKGPRPVPR